MSALISLECSECRASYDADQLQTICKTSGSPLLAYYGLARLAGELDSVRD